MYIVFDINTDAICRQSVSRGVGGLQSRAGVVAELGRALVALSHDSVQAITDLRYVHVTVAIGLDGISLSYRGRISVRYW